MKKEEPLQLIMDLGMGFYGAIGAVMDVSPLGYGELAGIYEERTGEVFYNETEGKITEGIYLSEILVDGSFLCSLDDDSEAIIKLETIEYFTDLKDLIYNEYIKRLEDQNDVKFTRENLPKYEPSIFSAMLKIEPFYAEPFDVLGYFESPSTIESSKNSIFISEEEDENEDDEDE